MTRCSLGAMIIFAALVAIACLDTTRERATAAFQSPVHIRCLALRNLARCEAILHRFRAMPLDTGSPVNDIVHGLLARGEDYVLHDETPEGVLALDWVLREASWKPLIAGGPMLTRTNLGWQFRRAPSAAEEACCEAHLGEFVFYLLAGGARPSDTCFVPPHGDAVPFAALIDALARAVKDDTDLSYVCPVLLQWGPSQSWRNDRGESIDYSALIASLLQTKSRSKYCGGCHWRWALAFTVAGAHDRDVEAKVALDGRRTLDRELTSTLSRMDNDGAFDLANEYQGDSVAILISFQAHTLEWVLTCVSDDELRNRARVHQAMCCLLAQLDHAWDSVPYRDLAHAAHAVRLYARRMNFDRDGVSDLLFVSRAAPVRKR